MKQKGTGFDATAFGAREVRYQRDGEWITGSFNPAVAAFLADGGGEYLQGATPIDPDGYPARYGGATPGVRWQGASAELLLDVGKVLDQAFRAGWLGHSEDFTGHATWQECLDYVACWPKGAGPFAELEFHQETADGSSSKKPIPVDDASRAYGAVWQLPPPDERWAVNVHGNANERPVLVITPGEPPPPPPPPPPTIEVPAGMIADLAKLERLSGTVRFGAGRRAIATRARKFLEGLK